MKTQQKLLSLMILVFLASCSGLRVVSETAQGPELRKYSSYTLADTDPGLLLNMNPTQKMQLEQALEEQAAALSTVKNNSGVAGPDVLINYFVILDNRKDYDTYTGYYGRRRWQYQITEVQIREYTEGTLLVDFIDARTRSVVWHGSVTEVISSNSIRLEEKIDQAVQAIFDQYRKDQEL